MRLRLLIPAAALALLAPAAHAAAPEHWVATWGAAPQAGTADAGNEHTVRQVVRPSIGGSKARVVFSNAYGAGPVTFGASSLGIREGDRAVKPGSSRALTFGGKKAVTIPVGQEVTSDPVSLTFAAGQHLAVTNYLVGQTQLATVHAVSAQTTYYSDMGSGNQVAEDGATAFDNTVNSWFYLSRIDVMAPASTRAVVAFGDSITDGYNSSANKDARYPDQLARRLQGKNVSVINMGIGANILTKDGVGEAGVKRFLHDALQVPGVSHVILLEGINDINANQRSGPIIEAYRDVLAQAHKRKVKVLGGTILPACCGTSLNDWSEQGRATRDELNAFIRTSKLFDGVVEFSDAIKLQGLPPAVPEHMDPRYDSGDQLHPSDAGYALMGDTVDLKLLGL